MSQGKTTKKKKIYIILGICIAGAFLFWLLFSGSSSVQMTDEEKEMLCMAYVDDEKIMNGELYDFQKEALKQFRMAKEYLQKKYPGYEYDFFYFSPSDAYNNVSRIEFFVEGTDTPFTVKIRVKSDSYEISDNFFEYALGSEYNEMITEMFSEAGLNNFIVHTRMGGYVGDEVYAGMPINEFVKEMGSHNVNVYVYVDMPGDDVAENNRIKNLIEGCLNSIDNRGGHKVFFAPNITKNCATWEEGFNYCREHNGIVLEFDTNK